MHPVLVLRPKIKIKIKKKIKPSRMSKNTCSEVTIKLSSAWKNINISNSLQKQVTLTPYTLREPNQGTQTCFPLALLVWKPDKTQLEGCGSTVLLLLSLLQAEFLFYSSYISRLLTFCLLLYLSRGNLSRCMWEVEFCDFKTVALELGNLNRKEFIICETLTLPKLLSWSRIA